MASELMPFTRMVLPPQTKAIKVQAWTDSSQVALAERTRRLNSFCYANKMMGGESGPTATPGKSQKCRYSEFEAHVGYW